MKENNIHSLNLAWFDKAEKDLLSARHESSFEEAVSLNCYGNNN